MDRRTFLSLAGASGLMAALPLSIRPAFAASDVQAILEAELASGRVCGQQAAAIEGTLARLRSTNPPGRGPTIVVDLPSQHLGAYRDGYLELESRVVVGDASWKTPDLDTRVSFIRFNPTWTVPESIIKARGWRDKLAADPDYFANLDFRIQLDGKMVSPYEAASHAARTGWFVQQPGSINALGEVKLGLAAGGAIYLHDTNDHGAFGADSRAISHGCIRVERAVELAAWCLGISDSEARGRVQGDDRNDYSDFPQSVRMVTTYFTAWPDANGQVLYYPDIYNRDGAAGNCGTYVESNAWGSEQGHGVTQAYDNSFPQEVIIYGN